MDEDKTETKKKPKNKINSKEDEDLMAEEIHERFKNDTIKLNSPFYQHFKSIKEAQIELINSPHQHTDSILGEENDLFNPVLIDHLENKYMPYIFLWSGLVLKGTVSFWLSCWLI